MIRKNNEGEEFEGSEIQCWGHQSPKKDKGNMGSVILKKLRGNL